MREFFPRSLSALSMSMALPQGKHITYNCYDYNAHTQLPLNIFKYFPLWEIRNSKDVLMLVVRLSLTPLALFPLLMCNYDKSVTQTCLFADWMYSSIGSALNASYPRKIFDLNTKLLKIYILGGVYIKSLLLLL